MKFAKPGEMMFDLGREDFTNTLTDEMMVLRACMEEMDLAKEMEEKKSS